VTNILELLTASISRVMISLKHLLSSLPLLLIRRTAKWHSVLHVQIHALKLPSERLLHLHLVQLDSHLTLHATRLLVSQVEDAWLMRQQGKNLTPVTKIRS
jgi:hypothetical protein